MNDPNGTMCQAQNSSNTAAIGCGSLILIGVMIFFVGRWSNAPMREDIEALTEQVTTMQEELQDLREEVRTVITITE